jgi:DNA-binding beta-propeller fold protein YncE
LWTGNKIFSLAFLALLLVACAFASPSDKKVKPKEEPLVPPMMLAGGRKLIYERSFGSEREVKLKRGFWTRVLDLVAGPPEFHAMVRPYSVASDSRHRIIVTDPGISGVHIFDFTQQKYKIITRPEGRDAMLSPQCVAVDAEDNIYVSDSEAGKIFVFDAGGKFRRVIGSLRGGEGYFKRPTGIAVDSAAQRIYVTATLQHKVYVLDLQGNVLQTIGKRGVENGEFNYPTEISLHGQEFAVVDAMNFRVQVFSRSGEFRYAIGHIGESSGNLFRPKGIGFDSEGDLYVVDAIFDAVQVFDQTGRLLYYFGQGGDGPQEFQLPAGLFIDRNDRIYVVDSLNRRVQIFRFFGLAKLNSSIQ